MLRVGATARGALTPTARPVAPRFRRLPGIPWIIGSLYHRFFSGRPDRTYHVPSGSLGFSVAIFCAVALVAIATLMLRRISAGGELGGRKWTTRALSTYFFSLWVIYVLIVSLADRGVIEAPF